MLTLREILDSKTWMKNAQNNGWLFTSSFYNEILYMNTY